MTSPHLEVAVDTNNKPSVAEIAQIAEEAKARLQQLSSTLTSKDGAATVTVNASGALQQLSFSPRADAMSRAQLAASVLTTAHLAQAQAARQVTAVMAPLIGNDSEAMQFLQEQIPVPEDTGDPEDTGVEPPVAMTPPPPAPMSPLSPPRPPAPPARPTRAQPADDDDESGPILRRDW